MYPCLPLQPHLSLSPFAFTVLQSPRSFLFPSNSPHSFFALRPHEISLPRRSFPSTYGSQPSFSLMGIITSSRRPPGAQNKLRPSLAHIFLTSKSCKVIWLTAPSPNRLKLQEGRSYFILVNLLSPGTSTEFVIYSALNKYMLNECVIQKRFFKCEWHFLENRDLILELRKVDSEKLGSFK